MKKITLPVVAAILFCFIFPTATFAYFTTSQSAIALNENTILFSIKYKFGMVNSDLEMPIGAIRNAEFNGEKTYLGYELFADGQKVSTIGAAGLVLSNAKVDKNKYLVPKGASEEFQLIVIAKIADISLLKNPDLLLKVTSLPFTIINNGIKYPNHLNKGELNYYQTPEVRLK